MQTRHLGRSDLFITPVGFGSWAVGGGGWQFGWGSQDDQESIAAIRRALELGMNWIDTAAVYGRVKSRSRGRCGFRLSLVRSLGEEDHSRSKE